MYHDRLDAGARLANLLAKYGESGPLVLGVPRGGVAVAAEVARNLGAQLDVLIARKVGAPGNPELAVAAVAPDGSLVVDSSLSGAYKIPEDYLSAQAASERREISRRMRLYRGSRSLIPLEGRVVIVVDDGIATGLTMAAALQWARTQGPDRLVLAVPVASPSALERLKERVDETICPHTPQYFSAVGQFYRIFDQTPDQEVIRLLAEYSEGRKGEE